MDMETGNDDANKILLNKSKMLNKDDLVKLSQDELVDKIIQLQSHNFQLRNILAKINGQNDTGGNLTKKKIDFDKCPKTRIVLKILYLGWDYQGYACQENSSETIEHHLIKAMLTCQLIKSRDTSNYHRCGRTDKGVSSFDQAVSITVRTAEKGNVQLDYCKMLNRLLPDNIRVLAWSPVSDEFSSRFDCTKRMYRYFFPKSNLDIQAMNEAGQSLLGVHDFRNMCKMDVANGVTTFIRSIDKVCVSEIEQSCKNNGYEMCQLELIGKAFLWHQVRCIMALLLLIGQGLEKPSVITELLDVEKNPRKPQYALANPLGLNLYKCYFNDIKWNYDGSNVKNVVVTLQKIWTEYITRTTHIESMITDLKEFLPEPVFGQHLGLYRKESRHYKQLLQRHRCKSLEDRIEHFVKKRKIEKPS